MPRVALAVLAPVALALAIGACDQFGDVIEPPESGMPDSAGPEDATLEAGDGAPEASGEDATTDAGEMGETGADACVCTTTPPSTAVCGSSGQCLVTLAAGRVHPGALAVDATHVYWLDVGEAFASTGAVLSVPIAGGAIVTLATGRQNPSGIAVDGTSVYWTDSFVPGYVMSAPLDGGAAVTLASVDNPAGIAVSGATVYYVYGSALVAMASDGGSPVTLA